MYALLWNGVWPSTEECAVVRTALTKARTDAFAMLPLLGSALAMSDGMEGLRAAVGQLESTDRASDRLRLTGSSGRLPSTSAHRPESLDELSGAHRLEYPRAFED